MIRAAVALLTRFPVATPTVDAPGAAAFPLVGAAIGAAGGAACLLLAGPEPVLGAVAAIAIIAICSGGLHLDGLADTADALASRDPAAAEQARQDPALGPTGAVALVLVLAAQIAALASVAGGSGGPTGWASGGPGLAASACVIAVTLGRAMPVVVGPSLAGRAGGAQRTGTAPAGFGAWFLARVTRADRIIAGLSAVAITTAVALVAGEPWLGAAAVAGAIAGAACLAIVVGRRGRLDGDGFGAGIELTVTATLVATALVR